MKKIWYNWKKPWKVVSIVCICLALVLLAGCFVNSFVDIEDGKLSSDIGDKLGNVLGISKTRNSQNLLDPEYYTDLIEGKKNGVEVTVNEDGSITLDGEATEDTDLELMSFDCDESLGFVFSCSAVDFGTGASASEMLLINDDGDGGTYHEEISSLTSGSNFEYRGQCTTSSGDCSHTIVLRLAEGDEFDNVTIYPVLNYGYVSQPFYEESEGLKNIFGKKRNSENLLDPKFYDNIDGKHSGVNVTVNEDGSITLDGKASEAFELKLIELPTSVYVSSFLTVSGIDFGEDASGACLSWNIVNEASGSGGPSDVVLPAGYDFNVDTEDNAGEYYTLKIMVSSGDEFDNVTIYPVLNYGVTAVSYFE